jgi:hypothetical protein
MWAQANMPFKMKQDVNDMHMEPEHDIDGVKELITSERSSHTHLNPRFNWELQPTI